MEQKKQAIVVHMDVQGTNPRQTSDNAKARLKVRACLAYSRNSLEARVVGAEQMKRAEGKVRQRGKGRGGHAVEGVQGLSSTSSEMENHTGS